jgi:hypothetical protein
MRASIDLSLNFAPYEISEGLQSVELGGQISWNQCSFSLQPLLGLVLGGQATKSTVLVRPKDLFCVNFGQE